ncbi:MAG: PQQ-binding-like beta-propeller repeat protein [Verrucomicrobiae bacterium]|nr:PQQ-binding-like beta-propeller repeat protein [Verrucomicrobiae bacterium]
MKKLLFSLSLATLVQFLSAADWPRFLGPAANGFSPETGINADWKAKPPATLWTIPLGDNGFAGPSVAGGKLFIIDHQGKQDIVRCLELSSGKDVWQFAYDDAGNDNYGFARATPTVDGDKLYTISRQGKLHCLDTKTGQKSWLCDIPKVFNSKKLNWEFAMSPVIDEDRLVLIPGGDNAAVAAVNKATGEIIWKGGGSDKAGYSTPVVATIEGKKQYVVFTGEALISVDAASGGQFWSFPWKTNYDVNAATPIVVGNQIFITSGYNHGCALLEVSGGNIKSVWENKAIISHFSTPIYLDGYLYCTGDQNALVCVDFKTGETKWRHPGFQKGGLMAVDGNLIVLDGKTGELAICKLSPQGYTETGRIKPLGDQSWTAPILADGKLIIRNRKSLACLDLK